MVILRPEETMTLLKNVNLMNTNEDHEAEDMNQNLIITAEDRDQDLNQELQAEDMFQDLDQDLEAEDMIQNLKELDLNHTLMEAIINGLMLCRDPRNYYDE